MTILQRYRIPITFVVFGPLLALAILSGGFPHNPFNANDIQGIGGTILVLLGTGLRSWAAGVVRKRKNLTTTGPYALTRHPLYVGSMFLALGLCIILGDLKLLCAVLAVTFSIYIPKVRTEERFLLKKFGNEWKKYTHRTGYFLPKDNSIRIRSGWSMTQWTKNKEYYCFGTALSALVLLAIMYTTHLN